MGGYAGTILHVDLTSGKVEKQPLDPAFARKWIGGLGFGARIYLDLIRDKGEFDALSAENPFVIFTGPLTGFKFDGVARWTVGTKSPQTGFWGDANVGGHFGARLKFAGYDGIVITGAAQKPVYIFIHDDTVEIRDAAKYWGMDTYQTIDAMSEDLKPETKRAGQVLTIGPAGENKVLFAAILNAKHHAAGRSGMGAVWGAKNLKAIYVHGTKKLEVAHPEKLDELKAELKELYKEHIAVDVLKTLGTPCHWDPGLLAGDLPMKNWQLSEWDGVEEIGPVAYQEKIQVGHKTCYGCSIACKNVAEVKDGPYKMEKGAGPEYETLCTFGTLCLNRSIESIAKCNDICNRYGMDTISCGATIAFAMDCYENGLITKEDTDGIELEWGNSDAIVRMTEKIGKQDGFGKILAMGSDRAAENIGGSAKDLVSTVKGLEAPMHDPRSAHGYGLSYATSPRGACHGASLEFPVEGGNFFFEDIPELAVELEEQSSEGKARLNVATQDFGMFFSHCAIYCHLGAIPMNGQQSVEMVNHVTGHDYTIEELMYLGRRIWYLKRVLSNLFGARREHDALPKRMMTPLKEGPSAGSVPDMDMMLREFYELRKFNEDGLPTREVLEELDLKDLADLLYAVS